MIDASKTVQYMQRWAEVNRELLDDMMATTRDLGNGSGLDAAYHAHLRRCRKVVDETLELEKALCREMGEERDDARPETAMTALSADMARAGIDLRERVWHSLFETAERMHLDGLEPLSASKGAWASPVEGAKGAGEQAAKRRQAAG